MIQIKNPKTLHNLQQLLGSINWVRSLLGINNEDLAPVFELLKGDTNLNSRRVITGGAKAVLQKVEQAIKKRQAYHYNPILPFLLAILGNNPKQYTLIFQWDINAPNPLKILEWVFLSYQPKKTIT